MRSRISWRWMAVQRLHARETASGWTAVLRTPGMSTGRYLFAEMVAGWYAMNTDLRAEVWYAFTC
jgi:hypothetical protein